MGDPMRTNPVDGSGGLLFQVDPASLSGAAGQLGQAYDDMNTAIAYYASAGTSAPAAFGDFGMADAWSSFDSAWSDELSVTAAALQELSQKVAASSVVYTHNESRTVSSFHAVGAKLGAR